MKFPGNACNYTTLLVCKICPQLIDTFDRNFFVGILDRKDRLAPRFVTKDQVQSIPKMFRSILV